jgi:hypothetical protein
MKSWKLMMLCSALSLAACQESNVPTRWADIQGKPEGFSDDQDDVRSDADVRAIARDEALQVTGASPASHITAEQVTAWDAQAATGDHRSAGYLTAETDPAFAASAASTLTPGDVTNWDTAFGWGNHAGAGYLKNETDPKVGAMATGSVPVWNGTALNGGALHEVNGNVGVGTSTPSTLLTVSTLAKFGAPLGSNTRKVCDVTGTAWTNSPSSASACTAYCTSRGFSGGTPAPWGSKTVCGGNTCNYISDFETCAVSSIPNNACDSCATSFMCTCLTAGNELSGPVRMMNGNVGIGVALPNSPLQVNGYLQLGTTTSAPPAADCDHVSERGRMLVDAANNLLWVCVNSGWISK